MVLVLTLGLVLVLQWMWCVSVHGVLAMGGGYVGVKSAIGVDIDVDAQLYECLYEYMDI